MAKAKSKLTAAEHKKRYGNRWANYSQEQRTEHMKALARKRMASLGVEGRAKLGQKLTAARQKNSKQ